MAVESIKLKCAKCGSMEFRVPTNPRPDDVISCVGCGAAGKYRDLQADALAQGKKAIEDLAREAFKKWGRRR